MKITKRTLKKIIKHMESCAPNEGCGFILKDKSWVPLVNTILDSSRSEEIGIRANTVDAPDHIKSRTFLIDPVDYIKHHMNLACILHSHISDDPENDEQSVSDMIHQGATGVEWGIIVLDKDHKYVRHYFFGDMIDD